jgi:hypothetical protein
MAGMAAAQLVAADQSGNLVVVHDGDPVALLFAPQGGHILLVGARIHADVTCSIDATGALRDVASNRVLGLDERALDLVASGDGYAQPLAPASLSAMPNVAVCPTSATTAAVVGNMYRLELSIGSQTLTASVIPTCAPGDTYCLSDCGAMP